MNQENDNKYAESYRIGYKTGYNNGIKDALIVFKEVMREHEMHIDDKEFFLALEELKE